MKAFKDRLQLPLGNANQIEMKKPSLVVTQAENSNLRIVKVESLADTTDTRMKQNETKQIPVTKCARPVKRGRKRVQTQAVEDIGKETQDSVFKKPRKPCKELDKLHEDIREMYCAQDILNLTNRRMVEKPKNFYKESRAENDNDFDPDEVFMLKRIEETSETKKENKIISIDQPDLSDKKILKCAENTINVDLKQKKIEETSEINQQSEIFLQKPDLSSKKTTKYVKGQALSHASLSRIITNSRYTSIHFNVCKVRIGVLSCCNFCKFETIDKNALMQHISQSHNYKTWSGFCVKCEKKVGSEGSSLNDEFNHLISHAVCKEPNMKEREEEKKDENQIKSNLPSFTKLLQKCSFDRSEESQKNIPEQSSDSKKKRKAQDVTIETESKSKNVDKPPKISTDEQKTKSNTAAIKPCLGLEEWDIEDLKKMGLYLF